MKLKKYPADDDVPIDSSAVRARVAVEAGSTFGWWHYTGRHDEGGIVGMRGFGASAPIKALLAEFGLTVAGVVKEVKETLGKVRG